MILTTFVTPSPNKRVRRASPLKRKTYTRMRHSVSHLVLKPKAERPVNMTKSFMGSSSSAIRSIQRKRNGREFVPTGSSYASGTPKSDDEYYLTHDDQNKTDDDEYHQHNDEYYTHDDEYYTDDTKHTSTTPARRTTTSTTSTTARLPGTSTTPMTTGTSTTSMTTSTAASSGDSNSAGTKVFPEEVANGKEAQAPKKAGATMEKQRMPPSLSLMPPYFPFLSEESLVACVHLCLDILGKGSRENLHLRKQSTRLLITRSTKWNSSRWPWPSCCRISRYHTMVGHFTRSNNTNATRLYQFITS